MGLEMWRFGSTTTLIAAAVVAVGICGGAWLGISQIRSEQVPGSVLQSIPQELIDSAHVVLEPASDQDQATVTTTREQALAWSTAARDGSATFPETELVRFSDIASDPPFTCLCWVVVVDSPELPYLGSPVGPDGRAVHNATAERWMRFDLIDARTGKYLYTVEQAEWKDAPPDAPWAHRDLTSR